MKKFFVLLFSFFLIAPIAMAKENYTTQNGISMDKEIYERLCEIYSEGFVETLTQDEYEKLMSDNLEHVQKVTYTEMPSRGTFYGDNYKTISIIKNGSYVTVRAKWLAIPSVNSYDVIAVRFNGPSLNGGFTFKQVYKSGGTYHTSYTGSNKTFSNGFGTSALLLSGTDQEYSLTFMVSGTGYVFGSYQHATSSVTLNQSKNYTLSSSGLGGVINFAASVVGYYDGMPGVDLSV